MIAYPDFDSLRIPGDLAFRLPESTPIPITIGRSGHEVLYFPADGEQGLYLKIAERTALLPLIHEQDRLEWLRAHVPVPDVRWYTATDSHEYLLLEEITGLHAAHISHTSDIPGLLALLARGLRRFHAIPVAECPFDMRLHQFIADARRRVEHGEINESTFDPDFLGRTAESILAEIDERSGDQEEDLVVMHGDYSLPNIIISQGAISGFIDTGATGIGDRYHDLVCAAWSVAHNLGAHHVPDFLREYGIAELDQEKFAFRRLLHQLF